MSPFAGSSSGNGGGEDSGRGTTTGRNMMASAAFGVRPGEGRQAWAFFLYFLVLATSHYAGKSVRQATYIDFLGADKLPYVYLLVALTSFPVLLLYSRFADRWIQHRLISAFCLFMAAGQVLFYWLYGLEQAWVPLAYYVWMTVAFGIAVSQFWSYANHVFDPRQARRLFAFIGAGGLLGGIPGGQIARLVSSTVGTRHTLLAAGGLMLVVLVLVAIIQRQQRGRHKGGENQRGDRRFREARGGLEAVSASRLVRLIALLMLMMVVVGQMVDLQFNWAIEEATEFLDQRTEVYGNFFSIMGLLAFIFQLLFTQRIHRVLGVGVGMRVLPTVVGLGTVGLLAAAGMLPAALFGAAWLLKLSETGLRHSLDQATRELLFLPVPSAMRRKAKAFVDVFVQRFAKGVAAILLLTVTFGVLSVLQVSWLTLVLTAVWIWITVLARSEYIRAFRDSLKPDTSGEQPTIDPGDVTTITTLVEGLGSSDPRKVIHSLDLLAAHGHGRLVPPVLLHHDDPEVRRRTLEILGEEGRDDARPLVERAITDSDPNVRTGAIKTLALLQGEDSQAMMLPRLSDPDLRLRSAAIVSLVNSERPELAERAGEVLNQMLADADPLVRREAANALGQIDEPRHRESVVELLQYEVDIGVVRETIEAVRRRLDRHGFEPWYLMSLIARMGNRRLKHDAREALVACGEQAIGGLILFMNSADEKLWVRRAVPKTVALLGSVRAAAELADSLDAPDAFLRRKIIEALAYMRSHDPEISFKTSSIRRQVRKEAEHYLRNMADLWAVSSMYEVRLDGPHAQWKLEGRVPTLLQQLLAQRMVWAVANLFGLLQLIYRPADVRAAYRSLTSGQAVLRARALEYLDNTLTGAVRRDVFAVIDDSPAEDKLRQAESLFGIRMEGPDDTLRRVIFTDARDDPDTVSLVLGALHSVYAERLTSFFPLVESLAEQDEVAEIRETARWVIFRLRAPGRGRGAEQTRGDYGCAAEGELAMAPMARIEMVVFLQSVDLFAYCNAEQVVRLAAIAHENHFREGEVIYRRNDPPDALYCVVEGRVALDGAGNGRDTVGPRDTFGVTDILSGQLRTADVIAAESTRVLAIEAEDFFDLLSNNIEIVKALFRRLTQHSRAAQGEAG